MIVVEAGTSIGSFRKLGLIVAEGTISAYVYLQNLPGLEYLLEYMRIVSITFSASI